MDRVMPWRLLRALALGCLAAAIPVTAAAGVGAGVGASPIELAPVAAPGNAYSLPPLYVVNTGTVTSSYRLLIEQFVPARGRPVPPNWITFARNGFSLRPKEGTYITMTLNVPADAAAGAYQSDVVAGTVAPNTEEGAAVGARAATMLLFTVGEAGALTGPWPPWACALIGVVLVIVLLAMIQRRFRLRVEVQLRR